MKNTKQVIKLIKIADLAIQVHEVTIDRDERKKIFGQMMFAHPCELKTDERPPCYHLEYPTNKKATICDNCKFTNRFHDDYIYLAHSLSNYKAQLNKAINEFINS